MLELEMVSDLSTTKYDIYETRNPRVLNKNRAIYISIDSLASALDITLAHIDEITCLDIKLRSLTDYVGLEPGIRKKCIHNDGLDTLYRLLMFKNDPNKVKLVRDEIVAILYVVEQQSLASSPRESASNATASETKKCTYLIKPEHDYLLGMIALNRGTNKSEILREILDGLASHIQM